MSVFNGLVHFRVMPLIFLILFESLGEIQLVVNLAVLRDNRQNTTRVVVLVVPVAGCHLKGQLLTGKLLEPVVLLSAGAVQTQLRAVAVHQINVGVVLRFLYQYLCLDNKNGGGVVYHGIQIVDLLERLVGNKGGGRILVLAVCVGYNGGVVQTALTEVVGAALGVDVANTRQNDLVAQLQRSHGVGVRLNGDDTCLIDEIEARLVYQRRTDDTLNGDRLALGGGDGSGYIHVIDVSVEDDGDLQRLGVLLAAESTLDGNGRLARVAAVHDRLTALDLEVNDCGVARGVGQRCALKAKQSGGYGGDDLQSGVARVGGLELRNAVVRNDVLGRQILVKGKAVVLDCDGQEAVNAARLGGLGVDDHQINGADLAVKLVQPGKIGAVALGVGVSARLAVQIVEVVVGKARAGNLVDQCRDLTDDGGGVLGNGGVQHVLDGRLLDPALVEGVVRLLVVGQEVGVVELVAALVAKLGGQILLVAKDPIGLGGGDLYLVADGNLLGGVATVNVDRLGAVHEYEADGLHAVGVGDGRDHAADLDLGADSGFTRLLNGSGGVSGQVDVSHVLLEFDQAGVLDLAGAVVVLQGAMQEHLVALDGTLVQCAEGQLAVGAVGAIDLDLARFVLDDHLAVSDVGDGLDGGADVIALGGEVTGLAAKLQGLSNGNGFVLGGVVLAAFDSLFVFIFVSVIYGRGVVAGDHADEHEQG